MKRILYIDHIYHIKTRSSNFFLDIIKNSFDVVCVYQDPEKTLDLTIIANAQNIDGVIIWQLDYLAPIFLAMGIPTTVIPMYDGSANMPALHWLSARGAQFINFSITLHERIRLTGGRSLLVKYFPEPMAQRKPEDFTTLRGFFWQRQPESGINVEMVDKLIGDELSSLHMHDVSDSGKADTSLTQLIASSRYKITASKWFSSPTDYQNVLQRCNVFFSPRPSEGIGMAFLEAMASGMCVIGHDLPTHNEYIANWINGVLFHKDLDQRANIKKMAAELGSSAWHTVRDGRREWLKSIPRIIEAIKSAPRPTPRADIDIWRFAHILSSTFASSFESYKTYLLVHGRQIATEGGVAVDRNGEIIDRTNSIDLPPAKPQAPPLLRAIPDDGRLDLTFPTGDDYLLNGDAQATEHGVALIGKSVILDFIAFQDVELYSQLVLEFEAVGETARPTPFSLALNSCVLGIDASAGGEITFALEPDCLKDRNQLIVNALGGRDQPTLFLSAVRFL